MDFIGYLMSECHIDNNLHLATGWVDVECDVTMLQAHFSLSGGTGHTSAIMQDTWKGVLHPAA